MKVVRISTREVEGGWVVTAVEESGLQVSEWFHPFRGEAIHRVKTDVIDKLGSQVMFQDVE